jgi:hypothetical protein
MSWGKHTRSWRCSPRARTASRGRSRDHPAVLMLAEQTSTVRARALLGQPRTSHYRDRRPVPLVPAQRRPRRSTPNALTAAEQDEVIAVLSAPRFCDKSVAQTWATLQLDEGVYLVSMSTMHRAAAPDRTGRRPPRPGRPRGPRPAGAGGNQAGQVSSWDITKLHGGGLVLVPCCISPCRVLGGGACCSGSRSRLQRASASRRCCRSSRVRRRSPGRVLGGRAG